MLTMKLSRITLKMSDLEEYEQLKRAKEKPMDTDDPPPTTTPQKGEPSTATGPKSDKPSRSVPRSSTPEHST